MYQWRFDRLGTDYTPRQFEFRPRKSDEIAFATMQGELCHIDIQTKEVTYKGHVGYTRTDFVIGLCWLYGDNHRAVISGSHEGRVCYTDISREESSITDFSSFTSGVCSVCVSCNNEWLLVSGYDTDVELYDIASGQVIQTLGNIHTQQINTTEFAPISPQIFSTCSFDGTVKTWDTRTSNTSPLYTINCPTQIITTNISPDEKTLITCGQGQELNQYDFLTGRWIVKHSLPLNPAHDEDSNYSRAYFSSSGQYIYTGDGSPDAMVNITQSYTGELLNQIPIYPNKRDPSILIQTLRGNPLIDSECCVLTYYRDLPSRELIYITGSSLASAGTRDTQQDNMIDQSESLSHTMTETDTSTIPSMIHHKKRSRPTQEEKFLWMEEEIQSISSTGTCDRMLQSLQSLQCTVLQRREEIVTKEQLAYEQLKNESLCLTCQIEKKCIALIPCGHVALCKGCCNTIIARRNLCPLCSTAIESTLKVFL